MPHPPLTTRLKVMWEQTPLVTKSIISTCTAIYLAALFVGWDNLSSVCLSADTVQQFWRLLTSATFHAGLLHLAFNMMTFFPMGTALERALGSFNLMYLVAILILLGDGLYISVSYLASFAGFVGLRSHCAVGFSGVIFGLIPLEIRASGGAQRSIFGLFAVPALYYPWILLVLWQFLVPQSSFLGHLSGLAIGQLYTWQILKPITPSNETVQAWERGLILSRCVAIDSYIANTGSSGSGNSGGSGYESLLPMYAAVQQQQQQEGGSLFSPLEEIFKGSWMAYPAALLNPQQTSSSNGSGPGGSSNSSNINSNSSQQPPISAVLGGVPAQLDPKAAAAAAAEARMKALAGGSSSSSK